MPTISIGDQFGVELLTAEAGPGSGIAKYFKGNLAGFIASADLVTLFNKPLASVGSSPMGLGFTFKNPSSFGSSGIEWTFGAGARSVIQTNQAGSTLFGEAVFGDPLKVRTGQAFLSVAFTPSLSIGAAGTDGDLSFGFAAGGSLELRTGRAFDITGAAMPSLASALKEVLSSVTIPGDVEDLKTMKPGDVAAVSGSGQFKVSASFNLAAALNPLATPTLGLAAIGALQLKAGASLVVGASIGISGGYQIRVTKLDESRVRLGYHKMSGSEFRLDVTASGGVSATLGKREFLTMLIGKLSTAPQENVQELMNDGLSNQQIQDIQDAITASIQRSLSLSLAASFAASRKDTAAFEYEFDLTALDSSGTEALHMALDGDLSPLTVLAPEMLPVGVKMLRSELDTIRKKSISWKINLLGIVNVFHLTELIRTGKVMFDATSGELLITDSIIQKSIFVKTRPLEVDTEKVRKVLMQSMVLTAAYRVTGMRDFLNFNCSQTYFDQTANARAQNVAHLLDNFVALDLIDAAGKDAFLANPVSGTASLFLELSLGDAAFQRMFRDAAGVPLSQEAYDAIGRKCVGLLVLKEDENAFRRTPMEDDALWLLMTDAGPASMRFVLPEALRKDNTFALIQHDYIVIRWWSAAMSTAAERIDSMLKFLQGADPETLKDNNEFKKRRSDLTNALTDIVKNSQPDFLDAWGLIVMDEASHQQGTVRGILMTKTAALVKDR